MTGPVQAAVPKPVEDPKTPAGQGKQAAAPPKLYFPVAHGEGAAVLVAHHCPSGHGTHAVKLPAGEYVPAGHGSAVLCFAPAGQYLPALGVQVPVQVAVVRPATAPYWPAWQAVH